MAKEYFWKQQDDIPVGMGYPLFGKTHLISVAITLIAVLFLVLIIARAKDTVRKRFLKFLPIVMVFFEVFKDGFLISVHRFGIGYLPLHVCSIGIFVFLLREFLPWKKAKEIFGEISFVLIMPASIAALFFADWTVLYPVWNFINLHSYIWHGALVLYPVLLMACKEISPTIKHAHWIFIFLCIVVPPIYIFDKIFRCNYFFVNWPVPDSPLSWFASFMGSPGYLIGYGVMTTSIILAVYILMEIIRKAKK